MAFPDPAVVQRLRATFAQTDSVAATARELAAVLGDGDCRVQAVAYFRFAFGLGISEAMSLGAWRGFRDGRLTDEELEAELERTTP